MIHSFLYGVGKAEISLGSSPSVVEEMDGLELLLGKKRRKQLCVVMDSDFCDFCNEKCQEETPQVGLTHPGHLCCLRAACSYFPSFHAGSPLISSRVGAGTERNPKSSLWLAQHVDKREPGDSRALGNH